MSSRRVGPSRVAELPSEKSFANNRSTATRFRSLQCSRKYRSVTFLFSRHLIHRLRRLQPRSSARPLLLLHAPQTRPAPPSIAAFKELPLELLRRRNGVGQCRRLSHSRNMREIGCCRRSAWLTWVEVNQSTMFLRPTTGSHNGFPATSMLKTKLSSKYSPTRSDFRSS